MPVENCANLTTKVFIMEGWPLALKFVEELLRSLATWTALADKDFDIRLFTGRPERSGRRVGERS